MIICIAEDRESCEPALKLLILSLDKYCGKLPINVFYPPARPGFRSWIGRYPQVTVHTSPLPGAHGWNVKPQALLYLMDQGFDQIIWIDCDIIITRDFTRMLSGLDPHVIAVAEEALWGSHDDIDALRARLWGFDVGRSLPFTLNTGVLRVTRLHYRLLQRWREVLEFGKIPKCSTEGVERSSRSYDGRSGRADCYSVIGRIRGGSAANTDERKGYTSIFRALWLHCV